jgi:hypothetical protein
MIRIIFVFGLAANLLICLEASSSFRTRSQDNQGDKELRLILLIPEDYKGWVCTDFGVAGAPPLPREGNTLIIRGRKGEILKTSTSSDGTSLFPRVFIETNGKRLSLPHEEVGIRKEVSGSNSDRSGTRVCTFIGTEDELDAAGDPPGMYHYAEESRSISEKERNALVALYNATDGNHWTHHVGWLGPPGTECKWHGVTCGFGDDGEFTVVSLFLHANNLVGAVPQDLGGLAGLKELWIFDNRLSGCLPDAIVRRWLEDALWISAEAPLLTDVTEVEYESEMLYPSHGYDQITLRSDGSAISFSEHLRGKSRSDNATTCEMKEGEVMPTMFAKLAWLIEKNGFYGLEHDYSREISDSLRELTRVTHAGKTYAVNHYAASGPFRLWEIERAIEGAASSVYWKKTNTLPKCPEIDSSDSPIRK